MRKVVRVAVVVAALVGISVPAISANAGKGDAAPTSLASYDGRQIDLSVSWEGATACRIAPEGNVCFDSAADLLKATGPSNASTASVMSPLTSCGSFLTLYS